MKKDKRGWKGGILVVFDLRTVEPCTGIDFRNMVRATITTDALSWCTHSVPWTDAEC